MQPEVNGRKPGWTRKQRQARRATQKATEFEKALARCFERAARKIIRGIAHLETGHKQATPHMAVSLALILELSPRIRRLLPVGPQPNRRQRRQTARTKH